MAQEDEAPPHIIPEEIRSIKWFEEFDGTCYISMYGAAMRVVDFDSLKIGIIYFGARYPDVLGYFQFDPNNAKNSVSWKVKYGEESLLDSPITLEEGSVFYNFRKFDTIDCL